MLNIQYPHMKVTLWQLHIKYPVSAHEGNAVTTFMLNIQYQHMCQLHVKYPVLAHEGNAVTTSH